MLDGQSLILSLFHRLTPYWRTTLFGHLYQRHAGAYFAPMAPALFHPLVQKKLIPGASVSPPPSGMLRIVAANRYTSNGVSSLFQRVHAPRDRKSTRLNSSH